MHGAVAAQDEYSPRPLPHGVTNLLGTVTWRPGFRYHHLAPRFARRGGDFVREPRCPPTAGGGVHEEQRAHDAGVLSRAGWRERVGIEPTGAAGGASVAVLKTGQATRPDPPPWLDCR